jgi:hypothetical protein
MAAGVPAAASAQTEADIVRVEEDWEMVVATPDPDSDGPQVTCAISPTGDLGSLHSAFELNQRSLPSFQAGGLQLQLWDGERPVAQSQSRNAALMRTDGESVRWTQSMRLTEGHLVFEILEGASTTWGTFGGHGYLRATADPAVTNLNAYRPEVSVANSGIGYAGNRVQSLTLKRVRYYTATGQMTEDAAERVLHQQQ